jgi:hypothetical protein
MSVMTKEDWKNWKQDAVTRLFYSAVDERIEDAKETLANVAGQDPLQDSFYRGFIFAYREMLEFKFEELDDEEGVTLQ